MFEIKTLIRLFKIVKTTYLFALQSLQYVIGRTI